MRMGERNSSMASSSIIPLKGQDFVGGIGKSSELQMHRTAGYFPLPWPAKESSFKTHLPVNILAWLWVISPVSTRPSGAWRCTCTNPETDLVTSDFPFSPDTTSCLIVVMIHPVSKLVSRILKGFLISAPLNLKFASFFDTNKKKNPKSTLFEWHHPQAGTYPTASLIHSNSEIQTETALSWGKAKQNSTATRVLIYKTPWIWNREIINGKKIWHNNRVIMSKLNAIPNDM